MKARNMFTFTLDRHGCLEVKVRKMSLADLRWKVTLLYLWYRLEILVHTAVLVIRNTEVRRRWWNGEAVAYFGAVACVDRGGDDAIIPEPKVAALCDVLEIDRSVFEKAGRRRRASQDRGEGGGRG